MQNKVRFLGLDVHAETIAVAVAEGDADSEVGCANTSNRQSASGRMDSESNLSWYRASSDCVENR